MRARSSVASPRPARPTRRVDQAKHHLYLQRPGVTGEGVRLDRRYLEKVTPSREPAIQHAYALTTYSTMNELEQIDFTVALRRLQGLIGTQIKATVNLYGQFFGGGWEGELNRVETLPPDNEAVSFVVDKRSGFYLDPADTEVYVGPGSTQSGWLEFRMAFGVSVVVERAVSRPFS